MTSLVSLLFDCLPDPDLMENTSDMLYELVVHDHSYKCVRQSVYMHVHVHVHVCYRYPAALRKFLQRVLELRAFVRKSLENDDMVMLPTCMHMLCSYCRRHVCHW